MLSDALLWFSAIAIIAALVGFIAWDSRHPSTCFDLAMHYQVFPELWFYLHQMECPDAEHDRAEHKNADHPDNDIRQASPLLALADQHQDRPVTSSRLAREPG
jgi:hypothetical protein